MTKVLLLASIGELDRVLLFDSVDRQAGVIRWVMAPGHVGFDEDGRALEPVSSPIAQYEKLASRAGPRGELQIDRAWAVEAVMAMIADAN
jgi:hypothetical protein